MLATLWTAALSLDTTAVLLTPVVLALAGQLGLDRAVFAYATPLPWCPGGRYTRTSTSPAQDRQSLILAVTVCVLIGPVFAAGADVTATSAIAALALILGCLVRAPHLLSWRLLPWQLILGVTVLFLLVQVAQDHGLAGLLVRAAGTGTGWPDLLRLAGVAALGANAVDNLPAHLAMEPVAAGTPVRMAALLVGVNAGLLITPWASLATLLWPSRCRAAGVPIAWRRFTLRGLILVPILLTVCTAALLVSR